METIIERLNKLTTKLTDLGTTMYSKWGTESYVERCDNADIRDEIIKVIERLKTLPIEPAEVSEEIIRKVTLSFWFYWYNHIGGTNTEEGFNKWWVENKHIFQSHQVSQKAKPKCNSCGSKKIEIVERCLNCGVECVNQSQEARPTDEIKQIVIDLAEWSKKYPRNHIYSATSQPKIDEELIQLEERAKAIFNGLIPKK
jgi:hypothetical protein